MSNTKYALDCGPPNDRRGFVHKRLLGAAKGLATGGISGGLVGFATGGVPVRRTPPRSTVARPSARSAAGKNLGRELKLGGNGVSRKGIFGEGCVLPFRRDPRTGECKIFLGTQTGRDDDLIPQAPGTELLPMPSGPPGEAVMGRFGVAMVPGNRVIDRAVCLRGMQLGLDGLCYNKGQINNSQRMWPKGRRPLLTGGEMRAISIASKAATRLTNTAVRLQEIGLIKKPVARKRPKKRD